MSVSNLFNFFSLAYFISRMIWLPLYLTHSGIARLPVWPFHHALGALGPLIAAFVMTFSERGIKGDEGPVKSYVYRQ
ncbi:MAG: hypothetical protein M3342_12640 [Bacteroidota bacterium]|nr:hypothetical protein [Bacteroidota bacterium]